MSEELGSLNMQEIQWPLTEEQESRVCLIYSIYEQYVKVFMHILNDSYLWRIFYVLLFEKINFLVMILRELS